MSKTINAIILILGKDGSASVLNGNFGSDSLQFATIFIVIYPRNAFFLFEDDYDALFCPKHANCKGIFRKTAEVCFRKLESPPICRKFFKNFFFFVLLPFLFGQFHQLPNAFIASGAFLV